MNTPSKAAILVDWDLFRSNPYTQDFVQQREGEAILVLLIRDPELSDYDFDNIPAGVPDIEWDIVIRNTGDNDNVRFKQNAIDVLKSASDMQIVIGLDASTFVNVMYRRKGVLITVDDL